MSKLERAIADLRADVERSEGGLVRVFGDQLTFVLDALEGQTTAEAEPQTLRSGDRVELVQNLEIPIWPFMVKGARGTLKQIGEPDEYHGSESHTHLVLMDDAGGHNPGPHAFKARELKKVG